jgi:hypothetical protein
VGGSPAAVVDSSFRDPQGESHAPVVAVLA